MDYDEMMKDLQAREDYARHMNVLKEKTLSYLAATGAPKDEDEVMSSLLRAAARGDADAQYHLGVIYAMFRPQKPPGHLGLRDRINNQAEQRKKRDAEAMFWFAQAAERGHSESAFALGLMHDAERRWFDSLTK
jgi:TPR repeat protein